MTIVLGEDFSYYGHDSITRGLLSDRVSLWQMELLAWDIYEISSSASLQNVMLRGRLRKFANQNGENFLVENDEDGEIVRFAVLAGSDPALMNQFVRSIVPEVRIEKVMESIPNPVLSKLKVNLDERYSVDVAGEGI